MDKDYAEKCQGEICVDSSTSPRSVADGCYNRNTQDIGVSFHVTMYFVRHGESEWNEQSAFKSEGALNEEGKLTDAKPTAKGTMHARLLSELIAKKGTETDDWEIRNGNVVHRKIVQQLPI